MSKERIIKIGKKMFTQKDLYQKEGNFRKERANFPFEKKIKILIDLQKLAVKWRKKKVIIWRI